MGLKSGSRDAGLDDEDDEADSGAEAAAGSAREEPKESGGADQSSESRGRNDRDDDAGGRDGSTTSSRADAGASSSRASGSQSADEAETGRSGGSIPYKLRRDKVNDGREQVPYFLREEVIDAEDDLQDALEAMLGEDVYKSDYREASMVVAQRNPELVAEVLREWGYDYDFD